MYVFLNSIETQDFGHLCKNDLSLVCSSITFQVQSTSSCVLQGVVANFLLDTGKLDVIFLVILRTYLRKFVFHSFACLVPDPWIDEFEHSKDVCGLTFEFGAVVVNWLNFQKYY